MKDSPSAQLAKVFLECRQKPRLLVVEDSTEDLELLQRVVLEADCEMCAVRSGDAAIAAIQNGSELFDVVLLDLTLPGVSGVEVLRFIKDFCPALSVVVVTGADGDSPLLAEAINIGVVSVKKKPVNVQDIQDILEHLNLVPPDQLPPLVPGQPMRKPKTTKQFVFVFLVILFAGCSYNAKRKGELEAQQEERVRENNQAANIANQRGRAELIASNFPGALVAYDISDVMIRRNQSVMGLPIVDQQPRVQGLIIQDGDEMERELKREKTERELRRKFEGERDALVLRGQEAERVHNDGVWKKFWRWVSGLSFLAIIGGLIALCVAFPIILPIAGRFIGFIVKKIPSAAGYIGAVSTDVVDSFYRGIEQLKIKEGAAAVEPVRESLSREMDKSHKELIKARRKVVMVDFTPPLPADPYVGPDPRG